MRPLLALLACTALCLCAPASPSGVVHAQWITPYPALKIPNVGLLALLEATHQTGYLWGGPGMLPEHTAEVLPLEPEPASAQAEPYASRRIIRRRIPEVLLPYPAHELIHNLHPACTDVCCERISGPRLLQFSAVVQSGGASWLLRFDGAGRCIRSFETAR